MRHSRLLIGLLIVLFIIAACQPGDSTPPDTPIPTAEATSETTVDAATEATVEATSEPTVNPTPEPTAVSQANAEPDPRYVGNVPAPEFPPGFDWLNTENPLTMDGLRGKIIILDFWTYGCINCIHMIPILEQVEQTFPNEVVIIGVHSAKFDNEGETENIRQIVQRYNLHHPVINDSDFYVWGQYSRFGVNAWPTFVIIDPRGRVVASQAGEIPFEAFEQYIGAMIQYYDRLGTDEINREPLEVALEGAGNPGTPLLFPGKVLADVAGNRLFIADSNHHRIVIANLTTYEVLEVIGTGRRGFDDGDFETATFNTPQGMALRDNVLYVADTNNAAIRAIDLDTQQVVTIAGTGVRGTSILRYGAVQDALSIDLRSPWDVEFGEGDTLYIAMAGTHQIWEMDITTNTVQVSVGSGRESLINLSLATSELAQPSGLFYIDGLLYFADSESSSIRVADYAADRVYTVAGPAIGVGDVTMNNVLFVFGDVDGAVGESRLQHPLGVTGTTDGSTIYITDTYNSRIKVIDPETNIVTTVFGLGGEGGYRDGSADIAEFDEPGGLDFADGLLYVADTNNHAIRVIDLEAGTVSTIVFPNPEALTLDDTVTIIGGNAAQGMTLELDTQTVAAGAGEIVFTVILPEDFKVNDLIDSTIVYSADSGVTIAADDATQPFQTSEVRIPVEFTEGDGTITADLTLYYCRTDETELCFIDMVVITVPFTISDEADSSELTIERTVTPPDVGG